MACRKVSHNCICSIENMENVGSSRAKVGKRKAKVTFLLHYCDISVSVKKAQYLLYAFFHCLKYVF